MTPAEQMTAAVPELFPALRDEFHLEPETVFLNHGSFGACPKVVLDFQHELQQQLEREPIRFMARELETRLDSARTALARLLGCRHEDLALVPNATAGVNTIVRSLALKAGDEVITTQHEYNASRNALVFAAEQAGAKVRVAEFPFPIAGESEILPTILNQATDNSRLLLIDHVTSPTGLKLPLATIVAAMRERGIQTLIDGAHAPGMLELDLEALGADFYTGNCHKWLCTPKGSAFLYVRRELQPKIRPLAISHGANSPRKDRSFFRLEFDWLGTHDPTPWLSIEAALQFFEERVPGGLMGARQRNHGLVCYGRALLLQALGIDAPCPESMLGSLASVPLPDAAEPTDSSFAWDPLQEQLYQQFRIEVPVMVWPRPPKRVLRISAQVYNRPEDYQELARRLPELLP